MSKLFILVREPFKVIVEDKVDFIIWFLFTIVTGQFGILANFIVRSYTRGTGLSLSILIESINGSFYTFAIALIASLLGPIFVNFVRSEKIKFRTLKTFTIIIAIFYLFVTAIIYASIQSKSSISFSHTNLVIDRTQLGIYLFAIILASYGYCILRLEKSKLDFEKINDPLFSEQNDNHVEQIIIDEQMLNYDPNGIEL